MMRLAASYACATAGSSLQTYTVLLSFGLGHVNSNINKFLLFFFCIDQKKNEKKSRLIFLFLKSTRYVRSAAQAALLRKCSMDSFRHPKYNPLDLLPKEK